MSTRRRESASRGPRVTHGLTGAQRMLLNMWTVFAVIFGALLGVRLMVAGYPTLPALLGGMILMPAFLRGLLWLILNGSGWFAGQMYAPSGSHTPSRPAYSGAESLAVRGRFEEAIAAYESAAVDEPDDPEPWLRIARIERFDLKRPDRALEALRAARTRASDASPTALMIAREIADVLLRESGDARRAMPELARLAAEHPDTPAGRWAARELAELKDALKKEGEA